MDNLYAQFGNISISSITGYSALPTQMANNGICNKKEQPKNVEPISEGLFTIGANIYYSNGSSYCYFPSMELYTLRTQKTNTQGVRNFSFIPAVMTNEGNCK